MWVRIPFQIKVLGLCISVQLTYCFSSADNRVCLNKKAKVKKKDNRDNASSVVLAQNSDIPFDILPSGSLWCTSFGVVRVILDNRATPTVSDVPTESDCKKWYSAKSKHESSTWTRFVELGVRNLTQRRVLRKLWEKKHTANGNSIFVATMGRDPRTGPSQSPPTALPAIPPLRPDPAIPASCYPDRIVACELVPDERPREDEDDETVLQAVPPNTRLFIRRRDLTEPYTPQQVVYPCVHCGRKFVSAPGRKYHATQTVCMKQKAKAARAAQQRREMVTRRSERLVQQFQLEEKDNVLEVATALHQFWGNTTISSMSLYAEPRANPSLLSSSTKPKWYAPVVRSNYEYTEDWEVLNDTCNTSAGGSRKRRHLKRRGKRKIPEPVYPEVVLSLGFKLIAAEGKKATITAFASKLHRKIHVAAAPKQDEDSDYQPLDPEDVATQLDERAVADIVKQAKATKTKQKQEKIVSPYLTLAELKWKWREEASRFMGPVYPTVLASLGIRTPGKRKATVKAKKRKSKTKRKNAKKTKATSIPALAAPPLHEGRPALPPDDMITKAHLSSMLEEQYSKKMMELKERRRERKVENEKLLRLLRHANSDSRNPLPQMVDVNVLINEVVQGRYPSFIINIPKAENLKGTWKSPHICYICKHTPRRWSKPAPEPLYPCVCCDQMFHWSCVLTKWTMKEQPEPNEMLLCGTCIGKILSKRARAEKRRIEKISGGWQHAALQFGEQSEQSKAEDNLRLIKEVVSGREYECITAQGRYIIELTELVSDAEMRLSNELERQAMNALRFQMTIQPVEEERAAVEAMASRSTA